eukprot:CAMPEP_0115695252 /NCGR_PEP_ID=MMETSP0272-20121206/64668_1 /TAXON_ID=71861 /ORGANISM="Scrippsiella trochoidea, Strain CCMP3099" /LENGTH=79 /DNA_ID=CAMNT_0003135441 /DNA_START=445 /DNA_END=680 /DNA_ORIENTATION=+
MTCVIGMSAKLHVAHENVRAATAEPASLVWFVGNLLVNGSNFMQHLLGIQLRGSVLGNRLGDDTRQPVVDIEVTFAAAG